MSTIQSISQTSNFADALKTWRKQRKLSQLDLAMNAGVSQRHLSWLETGRSKPSRDMIFKLSEAMDIPLRDRNILFNAAGFTDVYKETNLDAPPMESVKNILHQMLDHHLPYPAYVIDRHWNIVMQNSACSLLFSLLGDEEQMWQAIHQDTAKHQTASIAKRNAALMFVHPLGLRQYVKNFDAIIGLFIRRLKRESLELNNTVNLNLLESLKAYLGEIDDIGIAPILPTLPIELEIQKTRINLTTVISSFGTPQDITAQELRLETFYPMDRDSAEFFSQTYSQTLSC